MPAREETHVNDQEVLFNRTGIMINPEMSAALIDGAKKSPPSTEGDGAEMAAERADYSEEGLPIGSNPVVVGEAISADQEPSADADRNGCDDTAPEEQAVADDVTVLSFDCPTGAEAELYRVEGGGHSWPGSQSRRANKNPSQAINANDRMWDFFSLFK